MSCFGLGSLEEKVRVILGTKEFQGPDIYKLKPGLSRGKMMIVNFDEFEDRVHQREGSRKDAENLTSLFHQIGESIKIKTET